MTDNTHDFISTPKGSRYAKGHKHFAAKPGSTGRMSIKRQRAAQAKLVADVLAQMADDQAKGIAVDPNALVRLLNAHKHLLQEL